MQSAVHVGRMRRVRHVCLGVDGQGCGRRVTYVGGNGRRKARSDHTLCGACAREAEALGRRAIKGA